MPKTAVAGIVDELFALIESRRGADPKTSYVGRKFAKGIDHIAKKVGEEAVEVAIAAARRERGEIIAESADLLFHLFVLWASVDIRPEAVFAELAARRGVSGIDAKHGARQTVGES